MHQIRRQSHKIPQRLLHTYIVHVLWGGQQNDLTPVIGKRYADIALM
jgi:hypothetical protein